MPALQFFFVACLAADHQSCREIAGPIFGPPISDSVCMLEGPAITDAWLRLHPDWVVREWTCRQPGNRDA